MTQGDSSVPVWKTKTLFWMQPIKNTSWTISSWLTNLKQFLKQFVKYIPPIYLFSVCLPYGLQKRQIKILTISTADFQSKTN
jgi:hypothetical protein